MRELFLKKHMLYVIVFILIWTIQLAQNYYVMLYPSMFDPREALGIMLGLRPVSSGSH